MTCTCQVAVCENRWSTDGAPCCAACTHPRARVGRDDDEPRCHWSDGVRMLRAHVKDCESSGCEGCEPCPERHCRQCGHEHVTVKGIGTDETCADCLHTIRTELRDLPELAARMLYEAMTRGVSSEAAMLIGPAADPDGFLRRVHHIRAGRGCKASLCPMHMPASTEGPACEECKHTSCRRVRRDYCKTLAAIFDANLTELHPAYVLDAWDHTVRTHLDHDPDPGVTVDGGRVTAGRRLTGTVQYLDSQLTRLAHDHVFPFKDLAAGIGLCHTHLENVLHDSPKPETGAPCPTCGRANLEHIHGDTHMVVDGEIVGPDDGWQCPRPACAQFWTEDEYRERVEGTYMQVADRLTASDIRATYRVPEGTVRRWASGDTPSVRTHGKDGRGRQLYDVADVLRQRDTPTPVRAVQATEQAPVM